MEVVADGGLPLVSPAAFASFYDHAAPVMFHYVVGRVLGDRSSAEDITQETFAAAVIAARAGRHEAITMPWVMGVARHKMVDHYRRLARDDRHLAGSWVEGTDSCELESLDSADPTRALEMLRDLRAEHRLVLILKYVDDLPAHEIAAHLDRSLEATNSLLSRAKRALAASMTENHS